MALFIGMAKELRHRSGPGHSNGFSHRRAPAPSPQRNERTSMVKLDEENGSVELTSSLMEEKSTKTAISHGHDDLSATPQYDADNTKNRSQNDVRSRSLFLQTAFWITAWYGTSLATLFLNKIILSRPGSSVHVLGMCQMTTAAVLGGCTANGGGEWIQRQVGSIIRLLPDSMRARFNLGNELGRRKDLRQSSEVSQTTDAKQSTSNSSVNYHFIRDMSIVGLLRGATVVLGLIALEHVPVSFVETIKATAPAFTVLFARLILKERTATPVMLTLIPVVAGLILCSASELRFDTIGFAAAVLNNCADCVQNVMSKRMLTHLKPTQLQFYTSVAALALQTPFVIRDAGVLLQSWGSTEDDAEDVSSIGIGKLLLMDAIFYHLQSVSAYCTMGCMSPVSQSVANTLKRSLLVWASILYFGNPITSNGVIGIVMVVSGVFMYNHVRNIHQR
ncbi:hypothetical protein ACHAWO_000786 [Cyclotella atomus]|uniref:Sugar phosphate transporter domain-containing protein n=1 Tax=Cyclotella atomus TaxID=382360 RepID=A0ABD3P622_9STRA